MTLERLLLGIILNAAEDALRGDRLPDGAIRHIETIRWYLRVVVRFDPSVEVRLIHIQGLRPFTEGLS